ncbi:NADP-dependent oxidoreductase [Lentzea nigeriaca]|uniref:NADP-dependent oxidoreductase n=1 Tax=Lentzea nigeriaca TaxID=1128665 RepID=UPI0019589DBC|nr:NADP-dependent oxidoreductase [Lentzea nigeriaca]MBM7856589.1 NADPH:quinone reductase-like Zn-dependent oxidoreductase [Lentzea nigeriaca]
MKAVVATDYGPPENYVVADVAVPRPGPGQIQVRIAAASINPADVVLPGGQYREMTPLEFPHVPGNDFAGTVTEVGDGVTAFKVGDEIFGQAVPRVLKAMAGATRPSLSTGSLAEYAVFEADTPLLAHRPPGLDVADAAALATTGLTARALFLTAQPKAGETALVVGATGGVGTALVPLLAAAGVDVIATATAADVALLHDLGAARTIGYTDAYPRGVDAAFNLAVPGDRLTRIEQAVRSGGRVLTITYPLPAKERHDIDLEFVLDLDGELGGMREVAEAAATGALRATISRRYTLDEGPRACADFVREHTTGKLVILMRRGCPLRT